MYKVNTQTKIGRAIKDLIENGIYKDAFHTTNISFLTQPNENQSELNIHIYPEHRLVHLEIKTNNYPGRFTDNDIHIPGCITNFIVDNIADINYILDTEYIEIEVVFGVNAASSRRYKEYTDYPLNSHIQKAELDFFMKQNKKLKEFSLKHSFNPTQLHSTIKIIGTTTVEFEFDTVQITAQTAIDSAVYLMYEKLNQ